jgi:hypothetical protein
LAEQFKQQAIQRDAERILPFEEIEAYSQSGLWAITVPKEFGGADVSSYTVAQIIALMSGVDGSIGQIPQNHFYALEVLRNNGTEQQKRKLYAEVLKGHALVMPWQSLKLKMQHKNKLHSAKLNKAMWSMVKSFIAQAVCLQTASPL